MRIVKSTTAKNVNTRLLHVMQGFRRCAHY
jgi:hypothetical protein